MMMAVVPGGSLRWDTRAAYFTGQRIKWKNNHLKAQRKAVASSFWTCSLLILEQRAHRGGGKHSRARAQSWLDNDELIALTTLSVAFRKRTMEIGFVGNLFVNETTRKKIEYSDNLFIFILCVYRKHGLQKKRQQAKHSNFIISPLSFHWILVYSYKKYMREKIHVLLLFFYYIELEHRRRAEEYSWLEQFACLLIVRTISSELTSREVVWRQRPQRGDIWYLVKCRNVVSVPCRIINLVVER